MQCGGCGSKIPQTVLEKIFKKIFKKVHLMQMKL